MIAIEEKEPIVIAFKDFKVEDWGDGIRKIADIEWLAPGEYGDKDSILGCSPSGYP